jgi:cytochrome b6-f complex iron-sulfur subunit
MGRAYGTGTCLAAEPPASAAHVHSHFMSKHIDLAPSNVEGHETDLADSSRRAFCVQACQAASCIALAAIADACGGGGGGGGTGPSNVPQLSTVNGTASGSTVQVTIDSASPLATVGNAALVRSSAGLFLVARTGDSSFAALTSTCTHQTCTVTGFDGGNYICPCHGSRFSTTGRVLNGPASAPLRSFNTSFSNNVLTIS